MKRIAQLHHQRMIVFDDSATLGLGWAKEHDALVRYLRKL